MLRDLKVRNFWSLRDTRLASLGTVCALVGKNGVGKTNVLKCIEWVSKAATGHDRPVLMDNFRAKGNPEIEVTVEVDGRLYRYLMGLLDADGLTEHWEILSVWNGRDYEPVARRGPEEGVTFIDKHDVSGPLRVEGQIPLLAVLKSVPDAFPQGEKLLAAADAVGRFLEGVEYVPLAFGYPIRSFVKESEYKDWLSSPRSFSPSDHALLTLLHLSRENKEAYSEVRELLRLLGVVDRLFVHSEADQEDSSSQGVDRHHYFGFDPSPGMAGHGEMFFLENLSSGTRRAIELVVSVTVSRATLLLIEQPEDSIHRGLLARLLDFVREARHQSQVVFSTHSSVTLDALTLEEVRLVSAPDGATQIVELAEDELRAARAFLEGQGSLSDYLASIE